MIESSTICAIATSPGTGAIAMVRISGIKALEIVDSLFRFPDNRGGLAQKKANRVYFGKIMEGDDVVDEVIVTLFKSPHSFTGEDTVEINCHGSVYIQQKILQLLTSKGASIAKPGEFTQRAFLNGKMDLSQAEAVADVIASSAAASHRLAINQMRGGFSKEISALRGQLLHFTAMIELELDFSEEDVEFANREQLRELAENIEKVLGKLTDSFQLGNVVKNGIPVVIAGDTNVGKSTLLNALLKEDKAIVSEIHGTTRDVIEDVLNIKGTLFRFSDTAGIRNTQDKIENLGIERTFGKIDQASVVLLVVDTQNPYPTVYERIESIRKRISNQKLIIVANKTDIGLHETMSQLEMLDITDDEKMVFISAKTGKNIDELIDTLLDSIQLEPIGSQDVIVTNVRHFEILNLARHSINRVLEGLDNRITNDFLAQDIRECLHYLGEITGEITTHEVLGHIFKNFCIGK